MRGFLTVSQRTSTIAANLVVPYIGGMAWFRRKDADSMDPQVLLAQGHEEIPLEPVSDGTGHEETPLVAGSGATGFRMTIQDVFTISGRGTVVVGRIEAGTVTTGATLRLSSPNRPDREVVVSGIEAFRKKLDTASAGENVGLLLRDITKPEVSSGDVLSS